MPLPLEEPMRPRPTIIAAGIVAALVALGGLPLDPPAAAAEAAVAPYDPPVGSRWKIVSEGREEKIQDGKEIAATTSTRTEELTIVEKTATGFRVSTVLRGYELHGGRGDAAAEALLGALRGVVVQGVVDRSGKPVRIENLKEVAAAHKKGFDQMIARFSDKPEVAAKLRELLEPMQTRLAQNPDEAAQLYLDTLKQLSLAQSTGLAVGEERRSSEAAMSPFGGAPIKTNVSLRLVAADPSAGTAKLVRTQAYDPAALKEFMTTVAKKIVTGASLDQLEKVMKELSLSMDDRTEFSLEHGMTRSLTDESSMSVKAMSHAMSKHGHNQITVTAMP
jgi:hypothetical protein